MKQSTQKNIQVDDQSVTDEEYEAVMRDLADAMSRKFRGRTLPSIEEQLNDLR